MNDGKDSDWRRRAEELFVALAELPVAEHDGYLHQTCADARLRAEVFSLLACDFDDQQLDGAIQMVAAGLAADESWVGRRIGAYRLTAELGHGGMGVVYLAERDDQRFDKKVAIKLVTRGTDSPRTRERLVAERRILANLDHPSIAKLLDGGETAEGVPYIVMEYVDGQTIDGYAKANNYTTAAACELVAQVCVAVAYAHRNLVVHRDLKPSNILVTQGGEPKLLDFGIAGLLEEDGSTGSIQAFTPKYAAPEVMAGESVSTAADVYSLGVLLSTLVPERAPDLDAIVSMAMSRHPAQRYPSAAELGADLRRFLGGFAVLALAPTRRYRTAKFVRRNRWAVAVALLTALGLAVSTATALWQARRANLALAVAQNERAVAQTERSTAQRQALAADAARANAVHEHDLATQQRDRAIESSRLAQQRLDQLTAIASTTVNGIQDTLENIPGAIEGRREILRRTLGFLDRARISAGTDRALLRTVAVGYLRMGILLGASNRPNLGDPAGGLKNVQTAERILSGLVLRGEEPALQVDWVGSRRMLADLLSANGKGIDSRRVLEQTLPTAKRWATGGSVLVAIQLAALYGELAITGSPDANASFAAQAVELLEPLAIRRPDDDSVQRALAASLSRKVDIVLASGDSAAAVRIGLRAAAIREELVRRHPGETNILRDLMLSYSKLSAAVGPSARNANQGDFAQALEYARKMIDIAERIARLDPANRNALFDWGMALLRTGMIEPPEAQRANSLQLLESAVTKLEELVRNTPTPAYTLNLAAAYEYCGRRLAQQGQNVAALSYAEKSLRASKPLVTQGQPPRPAYLQVLHSYQLLVRLAPYAWNREKSVALANEATVAAERYIQVYPNLDQFVARIWEARGDMFQQLGEVPQACQSYRQSADAWKQLPQPGLPVNPQERDLVNTKLGKCP